MVNQRDFILDLARTNESASDIMSKIKIVYKEAAYNRSQVYRLMAVAKSSKGDEDLESGRGRGTKKTVRTADKIDEIDALVKADRNMSVEDMAAETGLSVGTVSTILHDDLKLSKKSARWVPCLLTAAQKNEESTWPRPS